MKRLGRYFILVFLIAVVTITITAIFLKTRKVKEIIVPEPEIVKDFSFSSPSELKEWKEKILANKATNYSAATYEEKPCIKAVSKDSASILFYRQELLKDKRPFISWDWKAEEFPAYKNKETLKKKDEFDFTAQVYVVFKSNFFLNSKAIQYVWTKELTKGTVSDNPYTPNVKILVLESEKLVEWKHEERDINKDFKNLFGKLPEDNVAGIGFMTDSDSTDSSAAAYYSNFKIGYLPQDTNREVNH